MIASVISSVTIFLHYSGTLSKIEFYKDYLKNLRDTVADIAGAEIADQYYNTLLNASSPLPTGLMIAISAIGILLNITIAVIYIKAAKNLNEFADTYG